MKIHYLIYFSLIHAFQERIQLPIIKNSPHPCLKKSPLHYLRSYQITMHCLPYQTFNPHPSQQNTYFPTTNIPLDPIPVAVPFIFLVLGLPCIAPLPLTVASPFIDVLPFSLTGVLLAILFLRLRLPSGAEASPSSWTITISFCCFRGAVSDGGAMYVPDSRSPEN